MGPDSRDAEVSDEQEPGCTAKLASRADIDTKEGQIQAVIRAWITMKDA